MSFFTSHDILFLSNTKGTAVSKNGAYIKQAKQMKQFICFGMEEAMEQNQTSSGCGCTPMPKAGTAASCGCTETQSIACGCSESKNIGCGCGCVEEDPLKGLTPAIAYIPWQGYGELYAPAEALRRGTIFQTLEFPFHRSAKL